MALTPKQAAFVREYLIDLNATQAAIRAGYSAKTAYSVGQENLTKPEVATALQSAMSARAERTEITADRVLTELWSIATADPNDLIEYRRSCCRFCWGSEHRHQQTAEEMRQCRQEYERRKADGKPDGAAAFDEAGGVGYNPMRPPHPECPECFGQGVGGAFVKDTRALSIDGRRLYAGVKITKDGLQVLMHDKVNALVQVGRNLGMFTDRHEPPGMGGDARRLIVKGGLPDDDPKPEGSDE